MTKRSLSQPTHEPARVNKALSVILGVSEDEAAGVWVERLANLAKEDMPLFLTLLRDDAEISAQRYKKTKQALQVAAWENVAGQHGVPLSFMALDRILAHHSLTPCYLPPSFHYMLFQSAWHLLDVFPDLDFQEGEAARVRTLEPFIMTLVAIFRGRIADIPEEPMKTKVLPPGGEVKHEICVSGGPSFLFVVELKVLMAQKPAYVAQLFLELLSAAKENSLDKFGSMQRVYGILTDLDAYHFYSYDPATERFAFDCTMPVFGGREEKLARMVPVTNKIFGIILSGYMEMLVAKASVTDGRAPPAGFTKALELSTEAHQLFIKLPTSKKNLEEQATAALGLLQQSITLVPRLQALQTNIAEPTSQAELSRVAEEHIDKFNPWVG
ncbi:hypothetical protein PENSPDRAFT_682097 [Peniophora sp. CONT]|nr:hypothetical protein PENSPDRAFT_682097 [Peniophora sp. CONT]